MLFIIIVNNDRKIIKRFRQRFSKTITNARIFRIVFEEKIRKELFISEFINMYNYYMNEMNNVD